MTKSTKSYSFSQVNPVHFHKVWPNSSAPLSSDIWNPVEMFSLPRSTAMWEIPCECMISSYIYVSVATLKQAMEELRAHLRNIGPFEVSVPQPLWGTRLKISPRYNSIMVVINNAFTCAVDMTWPLPGWCSCISLGFVITLSSTDALNDDIKGTSFSKSRGCQKRGNPQSWKTAWEQLENAASHC